MSEKGCRTSPDKREEYEIVMNRATNIVATLLFGSSEARMRAEREIAGLKEESCKENGQFASKVLQKIDILNGLREQ